MGSESARPFGAKRDIAHFQWAWRDGRAVEGAVLERLCGSDLTLGSNPSLSANFAKQNWRDLAKRILADPPSYAKATEWLSPSLGFNPQITLEGSIVRL